MTTGSPNVLNKVSGSAEEALEGLQDGAVILIGGSSAHDVPHSLLRAVLSSEAGHLTVITGVPNLDSLAESGKVRKLISPLPFDPRTGGPVKEMWEAGDLELEVHPTGVLTERIRAGGAGIGGLFLPTGVGTRFAGGRELREINGRPHVFQTALKADFALLRASRSRQPRQPRLLRDPAQLEPRHGHGSERNRRRGGRDLRTRRP